MSFSLVYVLGRAIYRIGDFFHHWYVDGSRRFIHAYVSKLEEFDRSFAFKITIRHFFEPLYKDYSIVGRILGVMFRTGRIVMGGLTYLIVSIVFLVVYLAWLLTPVAIIGYAILNL